MKQKGFVLVSVLVITTITTMLAFSQLKTNSLQERMAGNQQKEINARLAAEQNIFDAFDAIAMGNTTKLNTFISKINTDPELDDVINLDFDSSGNIFALESTGEFGGATAYLKAVIKGTEGDAIIACESVNVSGNGHIKGDVTVIEGNATFSGNGSIAGYVTASGSVTGVPEDHYSVISRAELGECDPLGVTTLVTGIATTGDTTRTNYNSSDVFSDGNVYVYDDFDIKNNDIVITGDVTLYIKNNMTTKKTIFTRNNTSSSLTIYIEGTISVDTGSNIFADQSVSANGKTPLTVYSSNDTDDAVTLSGNGEIYMNLYAPLGTIAYNGNGNIMGALRGEVVDISGNGGIYYDQGLGAPASYCAIYYYYPKDTDILNAADYINYCGGSEDSEVIVQPLFCGYSPRSYDDQYSEFQGAAAEAATAVATAAAAAKTAVDLAAAEAIRIAGLSTAAERTIVTAAVAYEAARMTRCTAYAAASETRWAASAAAAATVAATAATALGVAEAANATDAVKTVTLAIVTAAKIAAAAPIKAVSIAATAAAKAVDVAAAAAYNAVVTAAAAAIEVTATTDATAKAALVKATADAATAEATAVAARLVDQTAADAKAKSDKILEVAAARKAALKEIDRLKAIVLAEAAGTSTTTSTIPTSTRYQNKNFWTTTDIKVITTVDNNGSTIEQITITKLISYKKGVVTGTTTTTRSVDENGNETVTTS
ncbi:hypothetical protein CXF72_12500 [Psychromonas sp. MB-3u-54]|uniref:pilus assembly PilX family protein n=1 Tax=Psychromonas sp. MB-3u-54 TaxID=2058319 RepID=UPI000C33366A|nr:pilus assembly PilX N-terminal domain-containing protein [Psychromonas sp. MB-3u-54]PKH02303.1 hypothetical protein CXF72_12500 [Psychromonas sp. MB-3u-54]